MIDGTTHKIIPELDHKGLRNFAFSTGVMFAALFGLCLPWLFSIPYPIWPWVVFVTLALAGLLLPGCLRPVHYWWMRLALLLSKFTTPLVMSLVFFLVLTPFGLIAGLFRKDPLNRNLDKTTESYRVDSAQTNRNDLENPY